MKYISYIKLISLSLCLTACGDDNLDQVTSIQDAGITDINTPDLGSTPIQDAGITDISTPDLGSTPIQDAGITDINTPDLGSTPIQDAGITDINTPDLGSDIGTTNDGGISLDLGLSDSATPTPNIGCNPSEFITDGNIEFRETATTITSTGGIALCEPVLTGEILLDNTINIYVFDNLDPNTKSYRRMIASLNLYGPSQTEYTTVGNSAGSFEMMMYQDLRETRGCIATTGSIKFVSKPEITGGIISGSYSITSFRSFGNSDCPNRDGNFEINLINPQLLPQNN